jgi:hypothetical protein
METMMMTLVREATETRPEEEDCETPLVRAVYANGDLDESGEDDAYDEWALHDPEITVEHAEPERGSDDDDDDEKGSPPSRRRMSNASRCRLALLYSGMALLVLIMAIAFMAFIYRVHTMDEESRLERRVHEPIGDLELTLTKVAESDIRNARRAGKCWTTPNECMGHLRLDDPNIYGDAHVLSEATFADIFYGLRAKDAIVAWRKRHYD